MTNIAAGITPNGARNIDGELSRSVFAIRASADQIESLQFPGQFEISDYGSPKIRKTVKRWRLEDWQRIGEICRAKTHAAVHALFVALWDCKKLPEPKSDLKGLNFFVRNDLQQAT